MTQKKIIQFSDQAFEFEQQLDENSQACLNIEDASGTWVNLYFDTPEQIQAIIDNLYLLHYLLLNDKKNNTETTES